MVKVLTMMGTRPEAIKLAPVVRELKAHPQRFDCLVGASGQHDELLRQALEPFDLTPDFDLKLMRPGQELTRLTARLLVGVGEVLDQWRPQLVLVQGDTTTVFTTALAAFYHGIQVGHVEAGLRTWDLQRPFPEEANRAFTDQISDFLFAPTEQSRRNLLACGLPAERIHLTGNTVVDALQQILASGRGQPPRGLPYHQKIVLLTAHRRESFGPPLERIFQAARRLVRLRPDLHLVYPVHPNPRVQEPARRLLGSEPNVSLLPPLDYLSFVRLMEQAHFILTDSGGIQEEAASLHKPVLILRDKTERMEVVQAGGALLVGSDPKRIVTEGLRLLDDADHYQAMSRIPNPYGDGNAAKKIVAALNQHYYGTRAAAEAQALAAGRDGRAAA